MPRQNNIPYISVIIITRNRPKMLEDCLRHLAKQIFFDFEIIVVDSSDNYATKTMLNAWPEVYYLSIWDGRNNMPTARNLGLAHARGEIVAFIDDDGMAFPDWLKNIASGYIDKGVGGVGGQITDNYIKVNQNDARIGQILQDGTVVQNFSRAITRIIEVDWFCGCNMTFRREILNELGGFDPNYGGNNSYEDVDMSTRVKKAGYRLILIPSATVNHVFAPRVDGTIKRDYENPQVRYHLTHNRAYYVTKNIGINKFYLGSALRTVYHLLRSFMKKPCNKNIKLLFATVLGFLRGSLDYYLLSLKSLRQNYPGKHPATMTERIKVINDRS